MSMINWQMTGGEIEAESFRRIDAEAENTNFSQPEWRVVRRLIHTTGDFSIAEDVLFENNPIDAGLAAVRQGAQLYCDSNMMVAGISLSRLRQVNPSYTQDHVHCFVADDDVGERARSEGITRSQAGVEKAESILDNGIVLIGNAPMALAAVIRMVRENRVRPRMIIAMPVGFVHVVEAKEMLEGIDVPHIRVQGYRGGTTLAVAALHGMLETQTTSGECAG